MAKKTLLDEAEKLPDAEQIRATRELERRIARLTSELATEKGKRRQAEAEVLEANERADLVELLRDGAADPKPYVIPKKNLGAATAIVCMTDWHTEEKVDPKTVNGLNDYNLTIAARRIEKAFANTLKLLDSERSISDIRDMVLWLGGDLITGSIHPELAEESYLSPTEACLFVQNHLACGIKSLLKHARLSAIRIVCSYGNHGRTTMKMRTSTAYKTSYEWLMYNTLAQQFAGEAKLHWQIATSYHSYFDVQGKTIRAHHGDGLKYQGGVGGLTIPVIKAISQWNTGRHADLDIFGHWHQWMSHPRFVSVPSLIGTNAYSISIKAPHEPPSQAFIVMAKNYPRWVTAKEIFVA